MTSRRDIINSIAVYGIELPIRCICAFPGQFRTSEVSTRDVHRFLVGTFSITCKADHKEGSGGAGILYYPPNKVHLIEYDESSGLIECTAVWPHPDGPILQLCNVGTAKWSEDQDLSYNLFSTIYPCHEPITTSDVKEDPRLYHSKAALFAVTVSVNGEEKCTKVGSFPIGTLALDWGDARTTCTIGRERCSNIELRAIIDGQLCVVTLRRNTQSAGFLISELQYDVDVLTRISLCDHLPEIKELPPSLSAVSPYVLAWDAVNQPSRCAVAIYYHIMLVDTRMKTVLRVLCTSSQSPGGAHGLGSVKSLYFPSTKANVLVSGGEDGCVIFWDCVDQPHESSSSNNFAKDEKNNFDIVPSDPSIMLKLHAHHHWIQFIAISPINEELLLTSSSDRCLALWHLDGLVSAAAKLHKQNTSYATCAPHEKHEYSQRLQTLHANDIPTCLFIDDFGDSVTACAWGCSTPWVFAGVSYNGKILVSKVGDSLRRELLLGKTSS